MAKFHKVAQTSDLAPGQGKTVDVDGRAVGLFNVDGTFYAIANDCTHMGGPLGDGQLDGKEVTCPWHGARFNVTTGACLAPPADQDVDSFQVKVEGDDVLVEID